jgi:hypothetical protein
MSSVSGLLLHYKLFNLASRRGRTPTGVNPYMDDRTPDLMRRHIRYAACMDDLLDRDLVQVDISAELADSFTLAERGLMRAPIEYRQWHRQGKLPRSLIV